MLFCCISLTLSAKGKRSRQAHHTEVAYLYSNSATTTVKAVSRAADGCSVTLCVNEPQGSSFSISPRIYLSDEQGTRHPLLRAEGIEIGKKEYITQPDGRTFTLSFEALPESTRYFDLIEGGRRTDWRIFGIHDKRDERAFPSVTIGEKEKDTELRTEFFTVAPITIKGRFTDYQRQGMPHIVRFNYYSELYDWTDTSKYPYCCMVQPDGTFEYQFTHDRPIWADMSFDQGGHNVGFYVRPGDVLEITFNSWEKEDERIVYRNAAGRATCEKLFRLTTDIPWNDPLKQAQYIEPSTYRHKVDSIWKAIEQGINYQTWKWHLTPWETHLLRTNHRLDLLGMYSQYINAYIDELNRPLIEQGKRQTHYLSEEDAAYLNGVIVWADPANVIPRLWYLVNNFLLSRTNVDKEMRDYLFSGKGNQAKFLDDGFEAAAKNILPDIIPILMSDLIDNEKAKVHAYGTTFAFHTQDAVADTILRRLATEAGSRYVQVVLLDPRGANYNHGVSGQQTWMADFRNDSTMSFIFVISEAMTEKDKETLAFWFQNEKRAVVSEEEFIHLQAAFRITAPAGAATINRDGEILTYRSDSSSETSFRSSLRGLKRLEQRLGMMKDN